MAWISWQIVKQNLGKQPPEKFTFRLNNNPDFLDFNNSLNTQKYFIFMWILTYSDEDQKVYDILSLFYWFIFVYWTYYLTN